MTATLSHHARLASLRAQRHACAERLHRAALELGTVERALDAEQRASGPRRQHLNRHQCLVGMAVAVALGAALVLWAVFA